LHVRAVRGVAHALRDAHERHALPRLRAGARRGLRGLRDRAVRPLQRRPRAKDVRVLDRLPRGAVLRAARRPLLAVRRVLRFALVAVAAAFFAACGPDGPSFKGSDVTGSAFGKSFALTDHDGKPRTLADYRGKAVVVFFGYVQCPDV